MTRLEEPGTQSMRAQLDIEQEDPRIFRPVTLREALRVARLVRDDETLPPPVRRLAEVGLVRDLMPGHLTPRRSDHGFALGLTPRTISRRSVRWSGIDPSLRATLVQVTMRAIIAERAAALR